MKNFLLIIVHFVSIVCAAQNGSFYFKENKGQIINQNNEANSSVLYLFDNGSMNIQLKKNGFSYDIYELNAKKDLHVNRLDIHFKNFNPNFKIIEEEKADYFVNYSGKNSKAITKIQHFEQITFQNVYPNIDFVFKKSKESGCFKYDIVLRPGAKMEDIELEYSGFKSFREEENSLFFETDLRIIQEQIPVSYLLENNQKVDVKFEIISSENGKVLIGFNSKRESFFSETLVIDPVPSLVWGKYIGDSLYTSTKGVITDRFGNVYICGSTQSLQNIATEGAYQDTIADSLINDAYVMKYHKYGGLMWSTYFGGEAEDVAHDVYVDTSFNVFLAGITYSQFGIVDSLGHQDTLAGNGDGFIAKFDEDGQLIWSTYLGGDSLDQVNKLSTDFSGNLYIAGQTKSMYGIVNQQNLNGGVDGFVAKIDSSGALVWSSYVGGSLDDYANGISFGDTSVYVVGKTKSTDLQLTMGMHQEDIQSEMDGFISKFNSNGELVWQTYFGGESNDELNSVKVLNNNIYVIGSTESDTNIIQNSLQHLSFQELRKGGIDAYVGKFNRDGELLWSSYFGGDSTDVGIDLFFELDSNLFIVGTSFSDTLVGISSISYQQQNNGFGDAFLSKIDREGVMLWSTFYGGAEAENAEAVAVYGNTSIYVVGSTFSDSSITFLNDTLFHNQFNSIQEGFFSKFIQGFSTLPSGVSGGHGTPCDTCPEWIPDDSTYTSVLHYHCPGDEKMLVIEGGDLGTDAEWVWYKEQCGNSQVIGVGDTIFVYPTVSTRYYVRAESITNATDCISTYVRVAPYPDFEISTESISCDNAELVLAVVGSSVSSATGNWTGPNNFSSDSLYVNLGITTDSLQGTYVLNFEDEYECFYMDSIAIELAESPIVMDSSQNITCFNGEDGAIYLTMNSSDSISTTWNTGQSGVDSLTQLVAGWYHYEVLNIQNGCSVVDSVEITSPASFLVDTLIHNTICQTENGSIILVLDTISAPYQILYDGTIQLSDTLDQLGAGNHTVTVVTLVNQCSESFEFYIESMNDLEVEITDVLPNLCAPSPTGQASAIGMNGYEPYTYLWSPTGDTTSTISDLQEGFYSVLVTDSMGCMVEDSIFISSNFHPEFIYSFENSSCVMPTGSIIVEIPDEAFISSIYWSTGDSISAQINDLWPGNYTISLLDTNNCLYEYAFIVDHLNDLTATISPSELTLNEGESMILSPETNGAETSEYYWSPSSGLSCSDCLNPEFQATNNVVYSFTISNDLGCSDTASVTINVIYPCVELFVPNIFSPNNDGLNDTWEIIGDCFQTIHVKVFNDWGQQLFVSNNLNEFWDGTFNGTLVPVGSYAYQIIVTYQGSGSEIIEGTVQVMN